MPVFIVCHDALLSNFARHPVRRFSQSDLWMAFDGPVSHLNVEEDDRRTGRPIAERFYIRPGETEMKNN